MSVIKGDFLGFTFDGVHSSELGIFRVSDGSRYSENLLPTIQDKTTQIPGNDGTYYQGSFYTQRQINFSIAFDNLSEAQLRRLKVIFGDKNVHSLIFDEVPYKIYKVKAVGTPNLKYVCFDKPDNHIYRQGEENFKLTKKEELYGMGAHSTTGRIYKGEGQLNFTAYTPYAKSRFKYTDQYTLKNIPEWGSMDSYGANDVYFNLYDWVDSSRMVKSGTAKKINKISYKLDEVLSSGVLVYNAGDLPTNFILRFYFTGIMPKCIIGDVNTNHLGLNGFELYSGDAGIQINSKLNLIEGINEEGEITGTIYNKYLISGDFFKIPVLEELTLIPIKFENGTPSNFRGEIDYQYLYY